jgi:Ca2+-binding RTX toxin-like protein
VTGDTLLLNDALTATGGNLTIEASDASGVLSGMTALKINASAMTQAITLLGNQGDDTLMGPNGPNDIITAQGGNNSIVGGTGDDTITAGNGADTISVGSGSNSITVGSGADTISITGAGGGTNTFTVGANTTIAYQHAAESELGNLNLVNNWSDSSEKIDLTAVIGATQNSITQYSSSYSTGSLSAALTTGFGSSEVAGQADYLILTDTSTSQVDTFVHVATGTGYSVHDMLVEIQGSHTLSITNGVVHH